MSDILSVCLQDILYSRKPELRKSQIIVKATNIVRQFCYTDGRKPDECSLDV